MQILLFYCYDTTATKNTPKIFCVLGWMAFFVIRNSQSNILTNYPIGHWNILSDKPFSWGICRSVFCFCFLVICMNTHSIRFFMFLENENENEKRFRMLIELRVMFISDFDACKWQRTNKQTNRRTNKKNHRLYNKFQTVVNIYLCK